MPGTQMESRVDAAMARAVVGPVCPAAAGRIRRKRLLYRLTLGVAGTGSIVFCGAAALHGAPAAAASVGGAQTVAPHVFWTGLNLGLPGNGALDLRRLEDQQANLRFDAHVRERLPRYQALFQQAALNNGIDWRLLAAVGYQESNWDAKAVSPTGVRGIMMLAQDTADELDVDREDPAECIAGGAQYFQQIRDRLPPQIREPDRTNMALAAYNQGLGHLQDARALAAELGGDPNSWKDVRHALPLLAEERWFSKARHGYAAGGEAVSYVVNVWDYYARLHAVPAGPLPSPLLVARVDL